MKKIIKPSLQTLIGLFLFILWNVILPAHLSVFITPPLSEKLIINFIERCQVKYHYREKNLIIFPIVAESESQFEYLTLEQGINQNYVEIKELGSGYVHTVKLRNSSKHYIFGLAGELIIGAKQDRMLKEDILIPPFSQWLEIPVYCTEQGRWRDKTKKFQSRGLIVPGMLRLRARTTESQTKVWEEVNKVQAQFNIAAETKALKEVYEAPMVSNQAQPYLEKLLPLPKKLKNCIGVIVGIGDQIICADLFANARLFDKLWEKLLRSYIIDALCPAEDDNGISLDQVQNFLLNIKNCTFTNIGTPGTGQLIRIKSKDHKSFGHSVLRVTGSALLFKGEVVHLDLFPSLSINFEPENRSIPRLDIRRRRLHR